VEPRKRSVILDENKSNYSKQEQQFKNAATSSGFAMALKRAIEKIIFRSGARNGQAE
jgi:hypothetical protein